MKRNIFLLALTFLWVTSWSQEIQQKNIPAVILNAFQVKFTNAKDIEWRLEKGLYRVSFELNEKDNQVTINDKGVITKHLQDLYVSEIPAPVMETIRKKVTFFDISDADLAEENGKLTYNIKMEINDKDLEFLVNEKGSLLKYRRELRYNEVPGEITSQINTLFGTPDVDDATYFEENGKGRYLITGEIKDMDHVFEFNDKNNMVRHEQDLRNSEVPVSILNSSASSFPGYEIRDADLIDIDGNATYRLVLKKGNEQVRVSFSTEGKILEVTK